MPVKPVIPESVPFGALASALRADQSGAVRGEYTELFITARNEARRRVHEPLLPQDHAVAAALAEGASECIDVIDAVWNALHP